MPILYRYLIRETLAVFLATNLILLAILLSFRLSTLLAAAAAGNMALSAVWMLIGLQAVRFLVILMPLAFVLAAVMTLGRLYRDHEISAALAAVQIDRLDRVIIVRNDFDNKENQEFIALINPEIVKYEGELVEDYEGCLSVRDFYGKVPRYNRIRVKALNIDGDEIRIKAEGFLARVIQHEIDHCNGIVFVDHIRDKTDAFYRLNDKGELDPLDYDTYVKDNHDLWD